MNMGNVDPRVVANGTSRSVHPIVAGGSRCTSVRREATGFAAELEPFIGQLGFSSVGAVLLLGPVTADALVFLVDNEEPPPDTLKGTLDGG